MTPALRLLKANAVAHAVLSYAHDPAAGSFGEEAARVLGLPPGSVFKTLLAVTEKNELLVALVPVTGSLDLKALAEAAGCKRCTMAEVDAAQRATGYLVGGISPLAQKKRHRTFIDASAQALEQMHVSAGRRGLEVALAPGNLAALTSAAFAPIGRTG